VFAWMHQNAAKPTDFFSIPANRVVELGTKIEIWRARWGRPCGGPCRAGGACRRSN